VRLNLNVKKHPAVAESSYEKVGGNGCVDVIFHDQRSPPPFEEGYSPHLWAGGYWTHLLHLKKAGIHRDTSRFDGI